MIWTIPFYLLFSAESPQKITPKYSDTGQPFIKFFSAKTYSAKAVNWQSIQDRRGVMYFANGNGVLEFDGITWRLINVPQSENVRAMTLDDQGTIYVCASKDFGFLAPDPKGKLVYQSLKYHLPQEDWNFGEIWDVVASSGYVYFKTAEKIFAWNGKKISIIDSVFSYRFYKIGNTVYTRNNGTGLMILNGDSLKLMPDGAFFDSTGVFNMLAFGEQDERSNNQILVTTNQNGLFLLKNGKFSSFPTSVDSLLIKSQIYNAIILNNGNLAFATQRGGVFILNTDGQLIQQINKNLGLPTNVIFDIFQDREGGLWLATLYGIVYCEVPSPFAVFQNNGMLNTMSNSVMRFKNKVYITNEYGVLYISDKTSSCELVKGSNKPAYNLFNSNGILWAGTNHGLVEIRNDSITKTIENNISTEIIKSHKYTNRLILGAGNEIKILHLGKNNQVKELYSAVLDDDILSVAEEDDGSLWFTGYFYGIYHLSGNMDKLGKIDAEPLRLKFYDRSNGLPGHEWLVYRVQNSALIVTDTGVFRFSEKSNEFIPDETLGENLSQPGTLIHLIEKGKNNTLWVLADFRGEAALGRAHLQADGKYQWQPIPELYRLDLSSAYAIYSDTLHSTEKELLWISTREALIRYKTDYIEPPHFHFSTLIRQVSVNEDSIVYDGYPSKFLTEKPTDFLNKNNNLTFIFSAATYKKSEHTKFRYFLEGNDQSWSNWTAENKKEYTNLAGGNYTFHVQSRNVYREMGDTDRFYFSIRHPWYLSWWAYLLYGTILLAGIFSIDRVQRSRIIRRERRITKLREMELIKKQAEELETIDNIVREINKELDMSKLLKVLLEQGMYLFPQAETGTVMVHKSQTDQFEMESSIGLNPDIQNGLIISADCLRDTLITEDNGVEKGVFICTDADRINRLEMFKDSPTPHSLLVMTAVWNGIMEAIVIFSNSNSQQDFNLTDARKLVSFREHIISAIAKARILKKLQKKNDSLIKTQQQLVTQQKLASLGQLTAGIAHEIKNPLNFVTNFAELSSEIIEELSEKLKKPKTQSTLDDSNDIQNLIELLNTNIRKINEHGKRADKIVRSMLDHSRSTAGERRETDINALLDETANLVYHGMRAMDASFNFTIIKELDPSLDLQLVIPQNISRAFLNILQNAAYSAKRFWNQPSNHRPDDQLSSAEHDIKDYRNNLSPTIWIKTLQSDSEVEIRIGDNGAGIPPEKAEKIFLPFYTTKPSGEGTGLGLSITHDIIVDEHDGRIEVESLEGKYAEFIIHLPAS